MTFGAKIRTFSDGARPPAGGGKRTDVGRRKWLPLAGNSLRDGYRCGREWG